MTTKRGCCPGMDKALADQSRRDLQDDRSDVLLGEEILAVLENLSGEAIVLVQPILKGVQRGCVPSEKIRRQAGERSDAIVRPRDLFGMTGDDDLPGPAFQGVRAGCPAHLKPLHMLMLVLTDVLRKGELDLKSHFLDRIAIEI